jgi:CelD/BcsL family acetyltransferase involved in cellulose biosynthesis
MILEHRINPLLFPAWDSLLAVHPGSLFFHRSAWAQVLHKTYGHLPIYFCRFADGQLEELLPVMEISSPWTGCRAVSLPFTDFCLALQAPKHDHQALYELAMAHGRRRNWKSLECRSNDPEWHGASPSLAFYGHAIDLKQGQEALFKSFNGAVQRAIRKAARAGLTVEFSNAFASIRTFYALHCLTRRRLGLPPQPFRFFENVARYVLMQGYGFVAIARLGDKPLSAAVFFHHNGKALYKFGASDYAFQQLRPNNILLWEAIKRCAEKGFDSLHLGRTSLANEGLRRFKLGFAAREERIEYCKYDFVKQTFVKETDHSEGWYSRLFGCMPLPALRLAGEILYPHLS